MENDIIIRNEHSDEYEKVENLVRESFWNVYRPGCLEHYVLHVLRKNEAFVPELDLVMIKNGEPIAQVVYVKASVTADNGKDIPVLTMGPICVAPEFKRKGYGKTLLDHSLDIATKLGYGAVCFEGNIDFYGKSGFSFARNFGLRYHGLPAGEDDSFFLCKELIPDHLKNVSGEYATPECYFVDQADVDEFDEKFPPKVKLKLPGQLF